jgi:hypothetical protein
MSNDLKKEAMSIAAVWITTPDNVKVYIKEQDRSLYEAISALTAAAFKHLRLVEK